MALTLENEFVVAAPVEPTWRLLLDLERVAACLPGASVEPGGEDGTLLGKMRVKLGPVTVDYKGTARLEQIDEAARTAVVAVEGKETRGQGSAKATIRNTLTDEGGSTRVRVETQLNVTGRPAQFGRGIMQDVAAKMLGDFAQSLSQRLVEEDGAPATSAPTASPVTDPAHASAPPLDLTPHVRGAVGGRVRKALGVVALAGFVFRLARRSRRRR
jgi:carbon monoxide dehydrogenase subunit G